MSFEEIYEVVDDQPIEWPEKGAYSQVVTSTLLMFLGPFVRNQGLGRVMAFGPFKIGKNQRRPGVAFIPFAKWPKGRRAPNTDAWDLVPNLTVEVISIPDRAWDLIAKVREYFDAGVEAVWLIYPNLETIHVYSSYSQIEVLTREQTLDGGSVVPGFRLALDDLFEGEAEPEDAAATEPAV